jgi:hypothetical protein
LLTLIDYTDTTGITSLPKCSFAGLLGSSHLIDASAVVIPSMTSEGCYANMFNGSTNLTAAPALPATTLEDYCYRGMFSNCSSLNEVTISANDISANGCLSGWLDGVAATGDFYNNGSATYPSGVSGIPTGWTEHTPV